MLFIKHCFAFIFLKKLQILYREDDQVPVAFVPIYGELNVWSKKGGQYGKLRLGGCVGEEVLVDRKYRCRSENCYAEADSALICINKNSWDALKQSRKTDQNL